MNVIEPHKGELKDCPGSDVGRKVLSRLTSNRTTDKNPTCEVSPWNEGHGLEKSQQTRT
jgi:hypothetical protein